MDRMQKQSILIVLASLEQQIAGLKNLVMIGDAKEAALKSHKSQVAERQALGYTSDEEDQAIGEGLKVSPDDEVIAEREKFFQDISAKALKA